MAARTASEQGSQGAQTTRKVQEAPSSRGDRPWLRGRQPQGAAGARRWRAALSVWASVLGVEQDGPGSPPSVTHTHSRCHQPSGSRRTYLFTTQLPWTSIATFWMPRRTAMESVEGPRRLIKLAKGMTFTEEGGRGAVGQGNGPGLAVPHQPAELPARRHALHVGVERTQ